MDLVSSAHQCNCFHCFIMTPNFRMMRTCTRNLLQSSNMQIKISVIQQFKMNFEVEIAVGYIFIKKMKKRDMCKPRKSGLDSPISRNRSESP